MEKKTKLDTYINGIPKLELIPKELTDGIIAMLELEISNFYIEQHKTNIIDTKQPT